MNSYPSLGYEGKKDEGYNCKKSKNINIQKKILSDLFLNFVIEVFLIAHPCCMMQGTI